MSDKKFALISEKMPEEIIGFFENLGYGCVRLPSFEYLETPVAHHPDMLFSVLDDGRLLYDGRYLFAENTLPELGIKTVASCKKLDKKYPCDIAFDALVIDGTVYGKIECIAPEITRNKRTVQVSQGYTLCSTLVTDKCAVTADDGIYTALRENGVNALKIGAGNIELEGYSCGFIGGASCYDKDSDTVVFFGDLNLHPDCGKITRFLKNHGHNIAYFEKLPLSDYGGAKLIK